MRAIAILVAGGSGSRMLQPIPKQFLLLHGKPVLYYSIRAFLRAIPDIEIVLVLPKDHLDTGKSLVESDFPGKNIRFITGGDTRFASVRNGLQACRGNSVVMVHDAVRCLLSEGLIKNCYQAVLEHGSAIPVVPVKDSIRIIDETGSRVLDRTVYRLVQTPQGFHLDALQAAFRQPYNNSFTDEATVMEASGKMVHLIEGEDRNIKITTPADLLLAESILKERL